MIEDLFVHALSTHVHESFKGFKTVGGGCINNAARLQTTEDAYFLKWNSSSEKDLFEKEALGLTHLSTCTSMKIPKVLGKGIFQKHSYLLLEWIESGHASSQFWKSFGMGLAKMHRKTSSCFGLDHDNYIGRLHQSNKKHTSWVDFFVEERLVPQVKLARSKRLIDESISLRFEQLYRKLPQLIPEEAPALLHGDLWSGNFLADENEQPVLIDPAIHYGHRETELAFTTLFGGFDPSFYEHYKNEYPLEPGFEDRIDIHNLYPLLVHVNLFGTSYLPGIVQALRKHV